MGFDQSEYAQGPVYIINFNITKIANEWYSE